MCKAVNQMMRNASDPAYQSRVQAAYDAGEAGVDGVPFFEPGQGMPLIAPGMTRTGIYMNRPRSAQGSMFVPDGTGGRTYAPTSLSKSFMPGPTNPNVRTIS